MTVEQRLEAMERELADIKSGTRELRATHIILVDRNGDPRAVLAASLEGPRLTLHEDTGDTRAGSLAKQGAELQRKPDMPVADLKLSARAENCLYSENIMTVRELVRLSEGDLLAIRSFGKKSVAEVKQKLSYLGLSLWNFRLARDKNREPPIPT